MCEQSSDCEVRINGRAYTVTASPHPQMLSLGHGELNMMHLGEWWMADQAKPGTHRLYIRAGHRAGECSLSEIKEVPSENEVRFEDDDPWPPPHPLPSLRGNIQGIGTVTIFADHVSAVYLQIDEG